MAEYINKAEVLKEIVRFSTNEGSNAVCSLLYCNVGNMSTTEIVHCSECKYWENGTMDLGLDCHTVPDHFCSDGER